MIKKYSIILVENDPDEQFFMKEGFDAVGLFDILAQLKNGDELFEWLSDHPEIPPDVILSDLNMPGKNGYDIISEIKNNPEYAQIPVIITSTSSTKTIIDRCLMMGASDYLVKPDTFIDYEPFVKNLYKNIEEKLFVK
jgi:CheY-like chemotaxis protein